MKFAVNSVDWKHWFWMPTKWNVTASFSKKKKKNFILLISRLVLEKSSLFLKSEVAQPCPTLCDPMDCSPPGSSVHGILQARILEWVAISFSRGSSQPRDQTQVSHIAGRRFNLWATREAPSIFFSLFLVYFKFCQEKYSLFSLL